MLVVCSILVPGWALRYAAMRLLTMWFLLILSTLQRHWGEEGGREGGREGNVIREGVNFVKEFHREHMVR